MKRYINDLKLGLKKYKKSFVLVSVIATAVIVAIAIFYKKSNLPIDNEEEPKVQTYVYDNEMKTYLAENVGQYLEQYILLKDEEKGELADIAVQTYDTILSSGVDVVTEEHTSAIEKRITDALKLMISDEQITDEDMELLASGVSQLIWDTVKTQLDESASGKEIQYKKEYIRLSNSLQSQIDTLEDKIDNLKISANIKIDSPQKEIEASKTEIYESVEQELLYMEEDMRQDMEQELSQIRTEMESEIRDKYGSVTNGIDGKNGEKGKDGLNGKDGKDGKNGIDGKDGKDGKNGIDGKTTYIAYADDENGNGFSLVPTETSKYIGTCISSSITAPDNSDEYQNWQPYRSYIITTTTDENGEKTVHIN